MNRNEAKKEIVATVEAVQGCKATELIANERILPLIAANFDIIGMIAELCSEGELVEIEYIIPNIPYRVKSFLFPKGTKVEGFQSNEKLKLKRVVEEIPSSLGKTYRGILGDD